MRLSDLIEHAKQRFIQMRGIYQRLSERPGLVESGPCQGLRIYAGPDTSRFTSGEYEQPVQQAIASLVHSGDVCYDIGANIGFFSLLLGRLVGASGMVYAFEPVPRNASTVERNARLNGMEHVSVLRLALSRDNGTAELLLAHHAGGAVLKSAGTPPDLAGSLMVQTASVDTLVEQQRIKPPNVIKIDVEGAELDALQGMQEVLRKWGPVVILELDDESTAGCEAKVSLCQAFLHNLGYRADPLPNAYPDEKWFVRHLIARRSAT